MNGRYQADIFLALMHYPVKNKNGDTIVSAVTNLDVHDIARAAKTYGAAGFYVVTPLEDQKELVGKIISHWTHGFGRAYNPKRYEALRLVEIKDSFPQILKDIQQKTGKAVHVVATCASDTPRSIGFELFRRILARDNGCFVLVFGTAWGLTEEFLQSADWVLEPIRGGTDYNHLSVRSAVSIILDRILGSGR